MIESAGMMRSIYITAWSSQMHGSEVSRSFVTTNSKSSSSFPSGSGGEKNKDRKKIRVYHTLCLSKLVPR